MDAPASIAEACDRVLRCSDPIEKASLAHIAYQELVARGLPVGSSVGPVDYPARPERPKLVQTIREVPTVDEADMHPSAHCLHLLAHIELNAIDLACDTAARFAHLRLPPDFYADFLRVAADEARHFGWVEQRMRELGSRYGDINAHDLLWQGCAKSSGDVRQRLAAIPMSQEARGLDAGPRLAKRLGRKEGDWRSSAIVRRIAEEERAHVAIGVSWFVRVCDALGERDYGEAFRADMRAAGLVDVLRGPFNHGARAEVGMDRAWYDKEMWGHDEAGACISRGLSREDLEVLRHRMSGLIGAEHAAAA
ncbi:unnamed protein product [Pedinophyceae sp. YPF-701]|nr:unnamed protein product [Pedinophyceae sp. YPF-701]